MPFSTTLLTTFNYATVSAFLCGAGWTVQAYQRRLQKICDEEQYDRETKCCPTLEELLAMRAAKALELSRNEAAKTLLELELLK